MHTFENNDQEIAFAYSHSQYFNQLLSSVDDEHRLSIPVKQSLVVQEISRL